MKPEEKHRQINEANWNEWAASFDGSGWRNEFLRRGQIDVIQMLDLKPGVALLYIGCGTGYAIGQAVNVVNNKGTFYGVDLSPKMVEKARENFKGNENVHFVTASAVSIPLEDNSFDVIICNHSFHHYLNPAKAVQEMHRLLKPGRKVHILDPTAIAGS